MVEQLWLPFLVDDHVRAVNASFVERWRRVHRQASRQVPQLCLNAVPIPIRQAVLAMVAPTACARAFGVEDVSFLSSAGLAPAGPKSERAEIRGVDRRMPWGSQRRRKCGTQRALRGVAMRVHS
jgi:hypothetical protein